MWSRQERTICRTQALTGVLTLSAPTISATISKAVLSPSASASRLLPSSSPTWRRASAIFALGSRNGRPCPGRQRSTSSGSTSSRLREELADRVGAVAVVEEEHGAAEQVIAGDHQLALGLVQDDVRGRMTRRLVDLPGAEVGLHLDPGQEIAVGLDDRVDPVVVVAAAGLAVTFEPGDRDAALARHLEPLLERRRRVVGEQAHVLPGRVHPELAAGALDDRRRQPVVIGVGVGADEQPHVLEPEAGLGQREVELAHPPLPPMPVSKRTMPPSAATAQTLPCGTPGQGSGSRNLQTPGSTFSARGASGRLRSSAIARAILSGVSRHLAA